MNASTFFEALNKRRSLYHLDKNISLSQDQIREIVEQALLNTPAAFNLPSPRAVVLFGAPHDKLWEIAKETLRKVVPEGAFASTEAKLASFAACAGTILYFEETRVVTGLQEQFPLYQDNFPVWAQQENGMLQLNIWTALELEGLGASLQHYNPLIDDAVKAEWKLPESWKFIAQMPFGNPTAGPDPKEIPSFTDRVLLFA